MFGFAPPPMAADGVAARRAGPVPDAGGRLPLLLLMAGSCLPILGSVLLIPVLPELREHFATAPDGTALVPMILALPALMVALLATLMGVVIDWLGRKRLLIVAAVLYALFGAAPLWLDSLHAIVASRALLGVAEAAIMTCCTTLIGDYYTGRERDRYLALQAVCTTAAATAFFVLGGALGSSNWRNLFWLYTVGLLLAPAMAAFLPKPNAVVEETLEETFTVEARPFPLLRLVGICVLSVFGAMVFYTVPAETAYLLEGLNVTWGGFISMVTAVASAANVVGCVIFASLMGRPERRLPVIFALCGAGLLTMSLAHNVAVLIMGAFLSSVATGLLLPSLLVWAMSKLTYAVRGRGTGLWTASFFLGQFLCPLAIVAVESVTGSVATAVGLLGLASMVVALGLLPLLRRTTAVL